MNQQTTERAPVELENPSQCTHTWTDPRFVMFTSGVEGAIRDCSKCGGIHASVHQLRLTTTWCDKGRGGKRGMPAELCINGTYLSYATCESMRQYMELPVPVVRMPPYQEPPVTYMRLRCTRTTPLSTDSMN